MKNTRKRILAAAVSLVLCFAMLVGASMPAYAEMNLSQVVSGLFGSAGAGSGSSINASQAVSDWLNGLIQEEEDSPIDKLVQNIKDQWNGVENDSSEDPDADKDVVIVIDEAVADNIAELFNISVNEIKKGNPGFSMVQTASMDTEIAQQLQGGLGAVTGIVEALIGTKDIFAGVIDGTMSENSVTVTYPVGNDIANNFPLKGKDYVADLKGADIKDYTVSFAKSGKYTIHIDLKDVDGSAADSGLANVFDVTDKAFATIELGTTSLNIQVMLKYINNYVELVVDRHGFVESYTMGMGITFMFMQEDGSYAEEMPYLGVNFIEEGIIYNITTYYGDFKYDARLMGDAVIDGKVNSSDARKVLRVASQLDTFTDEDVKYCDVTGDGKITSADAREILRAAVGMITLPTAEEMLGIKPYEKSDAVEKQVDDLRVILMAYQSAKDEEAKNELQDYYDKLYGDGSGTAEETTTGQMNSTGNKVDDFIGGVGDIINAGNQNGLWGDIITGIGGILLKK